MPTPEEEQAAALKAWVMQQLGGATDAAGLTTGAGGSSYAPSKAKQGIPYLDPIAQLQQLAGADVSEMQKSAYLAGTPGYGLPRFAQPGTPASDTAINDATTRIMSGQGTQMDVSTLLAAGYTTTEIKLLAGGGTGGGSGDGVGYANLAQRQQEFAYQQEQDKVALAINILKALGEQQGTFDSRQQATTGNQLAALPYLADSPGMAYAPNMGPDSYGVRMGLTTPFATPHMQFDPRVGTGNPYDTQAADALRRLQAIAQ